jgi:hypothetical protein
MKAFFRSEAMKLTPNRLALGIAIGGCFVLLVALVAIGGGQGKQESTAKPSTTIGDASSASHVSPLNTVQRETAHVMSVDTSKGIGWRLSELRKTLNPHDAFSAYQIVSSCRNLQNRELMLVNLPASAEQARQYAEFHKSEAQSLAECKDLSGSDAMGWQQDLLRAVTAKVPGAVMAFVFEGPFGDQNALVDRSDDPLVVQWKAQALKYLVGSANDGDIHSLRALANAYDFDNGGAPRFVDQSLAETVVYLTAAIEILKVRSDRYQAEMKWRDSTVKKMDAAAAAAAIRRGEEIAKTCCTKG